MATRPVIKKTVEEIAEETLEAGAKKGAKEIAEKVSKETVEDLPKVVTKALDDKIDDAMKKFDSSTATNKQKGNFGEMAAHKNRMKNPNLKRLGDNPPSKLNDKIKKGIDGIYENMVYPPPPKYIIDEAKYGTSKLSKTVDGNKQMSDGWLNAKKNKRIRDQFPNDKKKAQDIIDALDRGEVERGLSKIDEVGNVTTQKLDDLGNVIKG